MNRINFFFTATLIIIAQLSFINCLSLNKKLKLNSKTSTKSLKKVATKVSARITSKQAEQIEQYLQNHKQFNEDVEREFKRLDKNNDGVLDENEARVGLNDLSKSLGVPVPTETEFKQLFSAFAKNGHLTLVEFRIASLVIFQHIALHFRRVEQARAIKELLNNEQVFNQKSLEGFNEFDRDHNRNLDIQEATQAINFVSHMLGIDKPSSEDVREIYKAVQNKEGQVGLNEFRAALRYIFGKFVASYKV